MLYTLKFSDWLSLVRLERLISQLKLTDKVTLAGAVTMERYKEYLRDCDVVVNTSLKEGAVTISFNLMAMGKPLFFP